ncbi:hypothetical protein HELRODRAFT_179246 [Helobdella robusta]|uniref:Uncharacterized protein n=1 Tax=Helobdella robusta TaxID=6412 RepID=T1FEF3_HELRO|nr:hypothetical protein HELRODRAFT_179246 [Helobdella robusta]ESN95477.1 hypothetical protein HELRODRAFT_179246 [Helobdella robusta]
MSNQRHTNIRYRPSSMRNENTLKINPPGDRNSFFFNPSIPPPSIHLPFIHPPFIPSSFIQPPFNSSSFVRPSFDYEHTSNIQMFERGNRPFIRDNRFFQPQNNQLQHRLPSNNSTNRPQERSHNFNQQNHTIHRPNQSNNYHQPVNNHQRNQHNHNHHEEYDPSNPWIENRFHPSDAVNHHANQPQHGSRKRKNEEDENNRDSKKINFDMSKLTNCPINIDDLLKNLVQGGLIKTNSANKEHVEKGSDEKNQNNKITPPTTITKDESSNQFQLPLKSESVDPSIERNLNKGVMCCICGLRFRDDNPFGLIDAEVTVSAETRMQIHKQQHSKDSMIKPSTKYLKLSDWLKLDYRNASIDYGEQVVGATEERCNNETATKEQKVEKVNDEDNEDNEEASDEEDEDYDEETINQIIKLQHKKPANF